MANWQKIDVSSSTIFRTILILIGFWFFYVIRDILLILFAAMVVAWAIEPLARQLARFRIPRAVTVVTVYILGISLISLVVSLLIPPLTEQMKGLAASLPSVAAHFNQWLEFPGIDQAQIVEQTQGLLGRLGDGLANAGAGLIQRTRGVLSSFFSAIFVFVITFYLVIEQDPVKKLCRILLPKEHVAWVNVLLDKAQKQVARWVVAQLLLGVIVGLIVGVGLWMLGIPYALVLGLIAGILEIVPVIGPVLAAVPGVIIGATQGWVLGLATLGLYWVVQQLENHILVPNIMRKAIGLNPLVTLIAVLLGARVAGIAGVILAVPAATVLGVFLSDLVSSDEDLAG